MKFQYYYIFIALLISSVCLAQNNDAFQDQLNEILSLRSLSNDSKFSFDEKIKYAEKAVTLSKRTKVDTLILGSKRNLSMLFIQNGDFDSYKKIRFSNLDFANKINDTISIAHSNYFLGFFAP